jgi:hypothetical protein
MNLINNPIKSYGWFFRFEGNSHSGILYVMISETAYGEEGMGGWQL